jgi:hypothetical protein
MNPESVSLISINLHVNCGTYIIHSPLLLINEIDVDHEQK